MYAIVDIAGQQVKVQKDQKIFVNRLEGKEGSKVEFDQVLLIDNDGKIKVGAPVVENTLVSATILSHLRGDTIKVFKKKRRKGYQKLNGHRQYLTQIVIDNIGEGKIKPKQVVKKEEKPKVEVEPKSALIETVAAEPKNTAKAAPKEAKPAATKKVIEKKPVKLAPAKKATAPKAKTEVKKSAPTKKAAAPKAKTTAKKGASAKDKLKE